jgi:heavy metal sensor kinase
MKSLSIRMRLTLWYASILAVTFSLLGGSLYYEIRKGLYDELDLGLQSRFESLESFLAKTPQARWHAELDEESDEPSGSALSEYFLEIRNAQGMLLYKNRTGSEVWIPRPKVISGRQFTHAVSDGRALRVLATTIEGIEGNEGRYTLLLAVDARQADTTIARVGWLLFSVMPLALLLSSAGGYWISRRALRPVDAISESALSIGASNLSLRLKEPEARDELQRLSRTLNAMLSRIEKSFKSMTQFTADASHELRTPVTLIRTAAELSLRVPQSESDYRETLLNILEESERTSSLIEGLLTLARGDSGSDLISRDRVDLSLCIAGVIRQARALAQQKQIVVTSELPEKPLSVYGDEQQLGRLLLILIENAIKYTPPGGSVKLNALVMAGCAVVSIEDSGIGISSEDLPHIFKRFFRADRSRSREHEGVGLGLAIAEYIAGVHDAKIRVQSVQGEGSIFTVIFPPF